MDECPARAGAQEIVKAHLERASSGTLSGTGLAFAKYPFLTRSRLVNLYFGSRKARRVFYRLYLNLHSILEMLVNLNEIKYINYVVRPKVFITYICCVNKI